MLLAAAVALFCSLVASAGTIALVAVADHLDRRSGGE
jgi:hypothetical protein